MLKEFIINTGDLENKLKFIKEKKLIGAIKSLFLVDDDLKLPSDLRRKFVNNENVGFLVGAGLSKLLNFPLWKELGYSAIEYLYDQNEINYSEFKKILDKVPDPKQRLNIFHNFFGKNSVQSIEFYKEMFNKPNYDKGNPYDILVKFECLNLSSNIDYEFHKSLEKYQLEKHRDSREEESSGKTIENKVEEPVTKNFTNANIDNKRIFQIHGAIAETININDTVLTTKDYLNAYYNEGHLKDFLEKIFNEYTIIFLGYGLEEFQLLEHIIIGPNNHYVLIGTYLNEMNLFRMEKNYFEKLKINPIHYYLDFNGYYRINDVLESWYDQITESRRQKHADYYENVKDIDEALD
jgi:hypothetical protein